MSSWARAVVTSCGHQGSSTPAYPYRLEKVKFGVPFEEVCKSNNNIPGPLLVLILKLNKESPNRRDVFRAPGHQGAMKKLIHFLQAGRLVNVDNYSVYTIASVLKKFLRKIPNGIFGRSGEKELFTIIELENETEQNDRLHRLFTSLPKYTQHLLVLLFGTFRVIASNAAHAGTGMTSEALGVSVAPSFFQSCVSDGKTARMEDVLKFKTATRIMKHIIDKFATSDLFGRDNYEYYARVTGRILKVQDEWICSFQHPPPPRGKLAQQKYALQHSLEAEKTWLQCQCERWGLLAQEESRSTPALLTSSSSALDNSVLSLGVTPEHSFIESCARLSVSLEGPGLFAMTSSPISKRSDQELLPRDDEADDLDENYADDDADDDDEEFNTELEFTHDDDIENNPRNNLLQTPTTTATTSSCSTQRQMRKAASVAAATSATGESVDHDELDDDEEIIVKRRYRQNRKKITAPMRMQMNQRRLRAGSKSLDGGSLGERQTATSADLKSKATATLAAAAGSTPGAAGTRTTRTCSRCSRGIRHSSSCSSTSGGGGAAAANGSGMTMDELRAVNRYAESTKSLSYLPQVHERQTARMRTRSEWFLGPKGRIENADDVDDGLGVIGVTLKLPINTCSNCCLAVLQQQKQQHIRTHGHSYLGGGSTREMHFQDDGDNVLHEYHMFYNKKLQQQQQQLLQPQEQHNMPFIQAEHMDTDECSDFDHHQQQQLLHSTMRTLLTPQPQEQQQQQKQQYQYNQQHLHSTSPGYSLSSTGFGDVANDANNKRMFLDTSTASAGNIRLSNSAESVQNPPRRPTASTPARRLIGLNVPRQYPLRASLRRNKEKQVGNSASSSNIPDVNTTSTIATTMKPAGVAMLRGNNAPPSVRNSIAECCSNTTTTGGAAAATMLTHSGGSGSNILTTTFPQHRLEKPILTTLTSNNAFMDTVEDYGGSGIIIYTTPTMISRSPMLSVRNIGVTTQQQQQQKQTKQTEQQPQPQHLKVQPEGSSMTSTLSAYNFKAPRI